MKKCPYCAEEIQDEAIKCRYCGSDLIDKTENVRDAIPEQYQKAFKYKAKTSAGELKEGVILALNQKGAIDKLCNQGLYPEYCDEIAVIEKKELNIRDDKSLSEGRKGSDYKVFEYQAKDWQGNVIKEKIEARDIEEAAAKVTAKNVRITAITEKFSGEQKGPVYVQCSNCKKIMSIDADTCPYCGKSGGFLYQYFMGGAIFGMIGCVLYFYLTTGMNDFSSSAIIGTCICNPIFWGFAIAGGIIGLIIGTIRKSIIKEQK